MNISNKKLKHKVKELVLELIGEYDPDAPKPKLVVSVLSTNKSNTYPAYKRNLNNKIISVNMGGNFITSTFITKEELKRYDLNQILSLVGHFFIKGYKENILKEISEEE